MNIELVTNRIVEAAEFDKRGSLRPLLLFMGSQSEGRIRSLWNLVVTAKDQNIPSVTEAVKLCASDSDYTHACGLHAKPQNATFMSILSRIVARKDVADNIPGLWDYARHLGNSSGGRILSLKPIEEYSLRVRSHREWREAPDSLRLARKIIARHPELEVLPQSEWPEDVWTWTPRPKKKPKPSKVESVDYYPYVTGPITSEHEMLMAIDAIVPKSLPNDVRCDVCQDMVVAVLSGETTLDNLRGDRQKYLKDFWKMFPNKYGHISLDQAVGKTEDMQWNDLLSAKHSRLV